jgi:hypothetical protein
MTQWSVVFSKVSAAPIIRWKQEYTQKILVASPETMTQLIEVCGMLLETKVHLIWKNPSMQVVS